MNEASRIADQLRRSYEGIAWHGPSLQEVVEGVTPEMASQPHPGVHTIWEIVLHVTAWAAGARRALTGNVRLVLTKEEDWPEVTGSWSAALEHLGREQQALWEAVEHLPDERLRDIVEAEQEYSVYFLLLGVVEHNLYHAGQIALLRNMAAQPAAY